MGVISPVKLNDFQMVTFTSGVVFCRSVLLQIGLDPWDTESIQLFILIDSTIRYRTENLVMEIPTTGEKEL